MRRVTRNQAQDAHLQHSQVSHEHEEQLQHEHALFAPAQLHFCEQESQLQAPGEQVQSFVGPHPHEPTDVSSEQQGIGFVSNPHSAL